MGFIKQHKVGITVVIVILLAFIVYGMFFTGGDEADLTSTGPLTDVTGPVGAELITTLFELKSLKLDNSIFNNNIFKALVDFSQEIPPEEQGRENPFAPLEPSAGGGGGSQTADDDTGDDVGPAE